MPKILQFVTIINIFGYITGFRELQTRVNRVYNVHTQKAKTYVPSKIDFAFPFRDNTVVRKDAEELTPDQNVSSPKAIIPDRERLERNLAIYARVVRDELPVWNRPEFRFDASLAGKRINNPTPKTL